MKVAVIGGTGLLGRALEAEWDRDELVMAGSRDVDVRDSHSVRDFIAQHCPDWVVLAAAYSDVDGCERNPDLAEQVNHLGAIHVAEACQLYDARLMLISTDYVFDGNKNSPYESDDAVCPVGVYAKSKAAAERDIRQIQSNSCIARISWLFGAEKKCFANAALSLAESGQPVRALIDQRGVPNYTHDVAKALAALVHASAEGVVHVTNAGQTTWYEFICEVFRLAGAKARVEPVTTGELRRAAPRPHYSVLSDASLRSYDIRVRHWREALPEFLLRRHEMASLFAAHPAG